MIIFELKNDGKKWPRIYFEIDRAQGPRREGQTETALMLCKLNKSL